LIAQLDRHRIQFDNIVYQSDALVQLLDHGNRLVELPFCE